MGILTEEMQAAGGEIRLSFASTASLDGDPNVSPKGSSCVLDGDHLAFADIASALRIANLRRNTRIEGQM
jgi:predicted pyridoxine 5'-phosphate oxidase superfamily flavin-nucleotide-binding protein